MTVPDVAGSVSEREYDAVVYDLDGTLVDLDVDWDQVEREVAVALRERGVATDGRVLWDMLERSVETGDRDVVEATIAEHEREGARAATLVDLASELPLAVPVGVVSLNCEAACRLALAEHGLADHVDVVIGRDTVGSFKPDPEPLLAAVEELGSEPERTLFVGDSASDRTTAERAGADFQWVRERA